jgi:cadmium resistance protein CadD (predicted permease)
MKYLGVYTAITAGFFFIGFVLGVSMAVAAGVRSAYYDWNTFIVGFIGISFLMFGFSVLFYLKKKEREKKIGEVDWT